MLISWPSAPAEYVFPAQLCSSAERCLTRPWVEMAQDHHAVPPEPSIHAIRGEVLVDAGLTYHTGEPHGKHLESF